MEKSQLDEFIEDMQIDWFRSSGITTPEFIEKYVRLAVEKHAEAVIPEKYTIEQIRSIGPSWSSHPCQAQNELIDEIKSASDKWRGI